MSTIIKTVNSPQAINQVQLVGHRCRFCQAQLKHTFVDLGMSPLCESLITEEQLNMMEPFYPLHVFVCGECFLVQLLEYVTAARDLWRVCLLFLLLGFMAGACPAVCRDDHRALQSLGEEPGSRAGQQ